MIRGIGGIINPYMNYGGYGMYGGYGSNLSGMGGYASKIGYGSQERVRKDHTLAIHDSDSAGTKVRKEAINRINAAGSQPQNAKGVTRSSTETDQKTEKWSNLNNALKKMDADDIRELYTMMRTAFGGLF